jgi:hypothetical protein
MSILNARWLVRHLAKSTELIHGVHFMHLAYRHPNEEQSTAPRKSFCADRQRRASTLEAETQIL